MTALEAAVDRAQRFGEAARRAIDARDVEAVLALLTDDVTWVTPAAPQPIRGRQDVATWISAFLTALPDVRFELVGGPYVSPDGRQAAYLWQVVGTMLGPGPGGLPPTGNPVTYEEIDLVTFDGDRAVRVAVYVDMLHVGTQIGLLP